MSGRVKLTLISAAILAATVVLQSTVLRYVAINDVKPDLVTIMLVFMAMRTGPMVGQLSGFVSGLVQDVLSLPPLGFYAGIRTVIGFVYGHIQGSMFVGSPLTPILFVLSAVLMKGVIAWILALVFSVSSKGLGFFGGSFWVEVGYTALLSPLVFAGLNLLKVYRGKEQEGA